MLSERESHFAGAFIAAVGLAIMAASLARLLAPSWPADAYLATFGAACGLPLVLVVTATTYVWVQGELSRHRVDELDAQARLARLQQPAQQAATPPGRPQTAEEQARLIRDHHWRQMAHRFITAGDLHGFGIRVLAKDGSPAKVISWAGWGEMTKTLRDAGVLQGAGDGTKWAGDWNYHVWQDEKDRVALPHPDKEPPDVLTTTRNATTQQSATATEQA